MKKKDLDWKVRMMHYTGRNMETRMGKEEKVKAILEKFEARIGGKKGAEEARDRFAAILEKMYIRPAVPVTATHEQSHQYRLKDWKRKSAKYMAEKAGLQSDEHGTWGSGDHLTVYGLDYVGPWESEKAPYFDMGGEGLGLVTVTRTRVYAKNSKWRPSEVSTTFLVGRNEVGTYFSHSVSPNCSTVEEAVQWIWKNKAYQIIQRQGDIALVKGNGGPKMPAYLPGGHKVEGGYIIHPTHPALPLPGKGERVIVARRAAERASEATRD